MDFIERWFGIYPDGGSGVLEALYVFAVVNTVTIAAAYWARRRGRRTDGAKSSIENQSRPSSDLVT
jgi:hypothetical protein